MVRVRGLGCNHDCAATATKTVANQCLPLEVSASRPSAIWVDESGFPFVIFQARLVTAGLIRLRRTEVMRRFRILEFGQGTILVNTNGV